RTGIARLRWPVDSGLCRACLEFLYFFFCKELFPLKVRGSFKWCDCGVGAGALKSALITGVASERQLKNNRRANDENKAMHGVHAEYLTFRRCARGPFRFRR